jgi:hypothetical protein
MTRISVDFFGTSGTLPPSNDSNFGLGFKKVPKSFYAFTIAILYYLLTGKPPV